MAHIMPLVSVSLFLAVGSPGSPELLAPPDQATMTWTAGVTRKPPVTFTWRAAAGTQSYRLRIATSQDFKHLVVDRTTGKTSEAVLGLEAGQYFWKVTIVDGAGNDVSASSTGRLALQ